MGLGCGQVGKVGLGAGAGGEAGLMRGRVWVQRIARGLGSTQRGRDQSKVGVVGRKRAEGYCCCSAAVAAGSNRLA